MIQNKKNLSSDEAMYCKILTNGLDDDKVALRKLRNKMDTKEHNIRKR